MIFECGSCGGELEVPDDFPGGDVSCVHCGSEISVLPPENAPPGPPLPDAPLPDLAGGVTPPPYPDPVSPAAFREGVKRKRARGCVIKLILIVAVLGGGIGYALTKMSPEELLERVSTFTDEYIIGYYKEFTGKWLRDKVYAETGLAPARYYLAKSLPGLSGQTGEGEHWEMQEEGKTYLVVEFDAAPRHFLPSDENYRRIVKKAEQKKLNDPDYEIPPRERCRLFDPARFQLKVEEGEPVRGVLISIKNGESQGFDDLVHVVFPEAPAEAADGNDLEEALALSVAFAVPESGTDLSNLLIKFDGLDTLEVPAAGGE